MLIDAARASLLVVDMQERLVPAMHAPEQVVRGCNILQQGFTQIDLPILQSEQYPKGLGRTVPELANNNARSFEKLSFSAWRSDNLNAVFEDLKSSGRSQVVVSGVEAHVCVLQTAVDLKTNGFQLFVVADAVSSRTEQSKELALARLRANGVEVVTIEMVLFELLAKAGTAEFKALSALIK
jgi:isochorismate hydrolase